MIALVCLVTGLLYKGIFPEQTAVAGLIYSVGVLVEGLPLLATAIRGFLQRDVTNAMEILVSIAVLACYITGQHELAILIPVVLSVVHFLEERSIMGGRDAIEGLKQMQATDAVLETEDGEVTVEVQALKRGDIIIVRPGMGLPIDGTVIWGQFQHRPEIPHRRTPARRRDRRGHGVRRHHQPGRHDQGPGGEGISGHLLHQDRQPAGGGPEHHRA